MHSSRIVSIFVSVCRWAAGIWAVAWRENPLPGELPAERQGGTGSVVRVMSRRRLRARFFDSIASLAVAGAVLGCAGASADTLEWALVQAYQNNPSLNAQRASLRATDENVPQALSGYRPKLSVTANGGYDYSSTLAHTVNQAVFRTPSTTPTSPSPISSAALPRPRRRRSTTAIRPPTKSARPRARSWARARPCASPSSRCCSTPRPRI